MQNINKLWNNESTYIDKLLENSIVINFTIVGSLMEQKIKVSFTNFTSKFLHTNVSMVSQISKCIFVF